MLVHILKWLAIALIVLAAGIQLARPARTNPPVDESHTIFARTHMSPEVAAIFNRSCADCHSNKTVWPWYTNVAPVSWFVANHVNNGRKSLNLSEWASLAKERQDRKLRQICDEVSDGVMPLSSYTPMHPNSKLSPADVKAICDWTDSERAQLEKDAK